MKPLYLNGRIGMFVALDEPALRVTLPGRAATLYPLQRISRVIASGPVAWETAALLACAERGITVTFLRRDGALQAYLFGESTQREGLLCRLQDLLDRPDWQERYDDWRRAMASRARKSLARRLGLDVIKAPSLAQMAARLNALKEFYVGPQVRQFIDRRLRGLLCALAAELLTDAGLSAERVRCLDERLDLTTDLVDLLAWDLHLPVVELLEGRAGVAGPMAKVEDVDLIQLFEGRASRLRSLGMRILDRLHGWLVELI